MTPHDRAEQVVSLWNPMSFDGRWMIVDSVEKAIVMATEAASDMTMVVTMSAVKEHIRAQMGICAGMDPHHVLDRLHQVFASREWRAVIDDRLREHTREQEQ